MKKITHIYSNPKQAVLPILMKSPGIRGPWAFRWCAQRAHVSKGESPQSARQREGYSQEQGCPG